MRYFTTILIAILIISSSSFAPIVYAQNAAVEAGSKVVGSGVEAAIDQAIKAAAKLPSVPTSDVLMNVKEVQLCFSVFGLGLCFPGLDKLAIMATKHFIERMVDSTVEWINNGFDGNPAYITNPEQYFTDIADGVAGEYIAGSTLEFLCSPFQAQVKLALLKSYAEPTQFQCTLDEVVGNIEAFYDDFTVGGWDAWFAMTQNDSNNPYGAYIEAKIDLDTKLANALGLKKEQLSWGRGFLSKETCLKNEAGVEIRDWGTGECKAPGPIVTPGSVIEEQLQKTLGTGISQLELADEFDELIGALLGQLLEKTVFSARGLFGAESVDGGSTPPPVIPPGEPGGQCLASGNMYADDLLTAMDNVLSENPEIGALPNIEAGGRQNARTFLALVEAELIEMGLNATDDVLNGNNNPNTGDLIAVWREGDTTMERYDAIIGAAATIEEAATADFTGFVPLNCTRNGGGRDCACKDDDSSEGTEPESLIEDLVTERGNYGAILTEEELGKLLNAVAWKNRTSGWVLLGKSDGTNCPSPAGPRISCDFLVHQPTMYGYDVLRDAEGDAEPIWSEPDTTIRAQVSRGDRTIVAPIAP